MYGVNPSFTAIKGLFIFFVFLSLYPLISPTDEREINLFHLLEVISLLEVS